MLGTRTMFDPAEVNGYYLGRKNPEHNWIPGLGFQAHLRTSSLKKYASEQNLIGVFIEILVIY